MLSAPTKIVFIIALVLAVLSLLPILGVVLPVIGIHSYWLLFAGFVVLVLGNVLNGL